MVDSNIGPKLLPAQTHHTNDPIHDLPVNLGHPTRGGLGEHGSPANRRGHGSAGLHPNSNRNTSRKEL